MESSHLTIIVSPHFDDAVISLGGFIAQRSSETIVVTVFAGKPTPSKPASAWALDAGFRSSDEEVHARIRENERALERIGARARDLAFLDQPYRDWSMDSTLAESIAGEISAFVKTHEPRAVHLYGPAALPRVGTGAAHTDHVIVHDAFSLIVKQRSPNVRCFYYEDIPYAAAGGANSGGFKALLESTDLVSVKPLILPLTPQQLQEKISRIGEYASQIRAAKQRGEDFQASALQFARSRGSNPWKPCSSCEIVYELLEAGEPAPSPYDLAANSQTGLPAGSSTQPSTRRFVPTAAPTSEGTSLQPVGGGGPGKAETSPPIVTAVIVTYRSLNSVGGALRALREGFEAGVLRCIVVDNASSDGTADYIAREHPWVRLIRSAQNLGYGRGCNLGLEQVQTPYILAMNPDVVIERDSVERLIHFMEGHPKAAMAAPSTIFGGASYQHVGGLPTPWSIVAGASGLPGLRQDPVPLLPDSSPFSTNWLCGAVMLIRTNVLRDLGGFDPRFFLYFEETDLCLRIRNAGHELWAVGEARAIHAGGSSVRRVDPALEPGQNLAVHFFPSRYYYLTKHHGRVLAIATEAAELVVKGLRDVVRACLGKRSKNEFRNRLRAPIFTVPPKVV